eukprot:7938490-Heterocapsa_arctica.AAC.1
MEWTITPHSPRKHMDAGALHTILADGVWTPERAEKRRKLLMGYVFYVELPMREWNTFGGGAQRLMD